MGRTVAQHERHRLARSHRELADGAEVLAVQWHGGAEHQHVGAGNCLQPAADLDPAHPRHGAAVIEPDREFDTEIDTAANAGDEAHEVGSPSRGGMK
jgi:hypothetical protein